MVISLAFYEIQQLFHGAIFLKNYFAKELLIYSIINMSCKNRNTAWAPYTDTLFINEALHIHKYYSHGSMINITSAGTGRRFSDVFSIFNEMSRKWDSHIAVWTSIWENCLIKLSFLIKPMDYARQVTLLGLLLELWHCRKGWETAEFRES